MSNVPEELDDQAIALLKKLSAAPERDPQAAAEGKAKFLAEAITYAVAPAQRDTQGKGNIMRLARIPAFLFAIIAVGLVVVFLSSRTNVYMFRSFGNLGGQTSQPVGVFVAGQNIPQGAKITEDVLATITVPQDHVLDLEYTVTEKAQLVGKIAMYPLAQGVVITSAMVGNMANAAPAYSAPDLHAGLTPQPDTGAAAPLPPSGGYPGQMVIKNGDIQLLVKDPDRALDGVSQLVTDMRGYVLSSRTWYQDYYGSNHKFATLTIGVPADQFDNALRRLRSLAVRVLDESASGQDVTEQYVDLQSQLTNQEATRDRIKSFLDETTTVDEAILVNQQLSQVEQQIEQIKGQMNYLSNRSAFSTITINLLPDVPEIKTTPTPTATPVAGLGPWDPGETTKAATDTLVSAYRVIANFLIWFFVVIVPVLGPPVVLVWLVLWLIRRRNKPLTKGQGA